MWRQGASGWWCVVLWLRAAGAWSGVGTVVDEAGAPVPRAWVAAVWSGRENEPCAASTRADEHGRFRLPTCEPLACADGVRLLALAEEPDRLGWFVGWPSPPLTVTVRPTTPCSGCLTDRAGRPLDGVRVAVASVLPPDVDEYDGLGWPASPWPARATTTDADGRWRLGGLGGGAGLLLACGGPPWLVHHGPVRAGQPLTTVLEPGGTLTGRVLTAGGQPVARARVTAFQEHSDLRGTTTLTDADGRYTLTGLWPHPFNVALSDWAGRLVAPAHATVQVRAGRTRAGVDFTAVPGVPLTLRVVDERTGRPLPGQRLTGAGPAGSLCETPPLTTDDTGSLTLHLLPGRHRFDVSPTEGWSPVDRDGREVTVVAGRPLPPLVFKLAAQRSVSGRLRSREGGPLANCRVCLADCTADFSDSAGAFHLTGVPPNVRADLTVTEPTGCVHPLGEVDTARLPTVGWRVTVPRVRRFELTGRVVDPEGQPVSGATVHLAQRRHQPLAHPEPRFADRSTTSDAAGRYQFARVPRDADLEVTASRHGYRPTPRRPDDYAGCPLLVPDGAANVDVVLEPCDRTVRGRVLDAAGQAVAGARVLALGWRERETLSGADGGFALTGLPRQPTALLALAGSDAQAETTVALGAPPVRLVVRPARVWSPAGRRDLAVALLVQAARLDRPGPADVACLARLDPGAALRCLAETPPPAEQRDEVYTALLAALAETSPGVCAAQLGLLPRLSPGAPRLAAQAAVGAALVTSRRALAAELWQAVRGAAGGASPLFAIKRVELAAGLGEPDAGARAEQALAQLAADRPRAGVWRPYWPVLAAYCWARWPALADRAVRAAAERPDGLYEAQLLRVLGRLRAAPRAAAESFLTVCTPALRAWLAADGAVEPAFAATVQRLTEALAATDPALAWRVLTALGDLAPGPALATLGERSPDPDLARAAEAALARVPAYDDNGARAALATARLAGGEPNAARLAAERALGRDLDHPDEGGDVALARLVAPRRAAQEALRAGEPWRQAGELRELAASLLAEPPDLEADAREALAWRAHYDAYHER